MKRHSYILQAANVASCALGVRYREYIGRPGARLKTHGLRVVRTQNAEFEASTHEVIKFGVAKILEITIDKSVQVAADEMLAFSIGDLQLCDFGSMDGGARVWLCIWYWGRCVDIQFKRGLRFFVPAGLLSKCRSTTAHLLTQSQTQ